MVKIWKLTIPQLSGDERRRAYVYLPRGYQANETQRYPVLYMFDGHNVFFDKHATYGKSWGMKRFMDRSNLPLIIAAVECTHDPNHGRLSEYSPFDFNTREFGDIKGRGRETMEWLVNEFKPMIDAEFRTIPERECTFLAGSSMGGLMTLYGLLEYNHIFSRGAALSPSIWFAPDQMDKLIDHAGLDPETYLYMDYGANELGNHRGMIRRFSQVTRKLINRKVLLNSRIVPDGDHSEASWEKQIPFFMETLFYNL